MKQNYTYAAIFDYNEEGYVNINFPMFEGGFGSACLELNEDPIKAAQDILSLAIESYDEENKEFPSENIEPEVGENQKLVYINVFTPYHITQVKEVFVKKTLTIPSWLNELAKQKGINFSATLTEALKERLLK